MCLNLTKNTIKRIASEDVVCYKRIIIDFTSYKGKSFTGIINGIECKGKIQIQNGQAFFCTDNPKLNGYSCYDTLDYQYSWTYNSNVQSIIVDGVDMIIPTEDSVFITPYQCVKVKLGETYTSELICKEDVVNIGLHSFTNYINARNDGAGCIVKCIIPKGAEYYEGTFLRHPSYASSQLKYVKVVEK